MRPLFQNFYEFLENNKDFTRFRDKLHRLLFMNRFRDEISISKLMHELDINNYEAKEIFLALTKYKVIVPEEITCVCDATNDIDSKECWNCGEELDISDAYATIDSSLPKKDAEFLHNKYKEDSKIDRFSNEWNKNREIVYILLDLVDSQNVQKHLEPQDYNSFLEDIRDIISNECLSYLDGKHLVLGEIGDCFIIALTYKPDAMVFFKRFSEQLEMYIKQKKYPKVNNKSVKYFPYFTATATVLKLPKTIKGRELTPKSIIYTTMNGSIGFNSQELTTFYRLDSGVGVKDEMVFDKFNLALWVTNSFIDKLNLGDVSTIKTSVGKKGRMKEKVNVGLLLFNNGEMKKIAKPSKYKKD